MSDAHFLDQGSHRFQWKASLNYLWIHRIPHKRKKRHSLRVALLRFLHWSLASQEILAGGIFHRAYRSCPRPVHPF